MPPNRRARAHEIHLTKIRIVLVAILIISMSTIGIDASASENKSHQSNNFLEVKTIKGNNMVSAYFDTIVIKNNSNSTIESVRIMLSPEIAHSYYLDKYSIKSIEPNGNATVSMKLIGKPNRDTQGGTTGYDGSVMVMAPNHNPVILPLKIGSTENYHYHAYMEKIAKIAEQRVRIPLISTILNNLIERSDIEITTSTGSREINAPSGEIVIKNTSDRTLTNVRLVTAKLGNAFLLDKYNIQQIAPNGEVSIQMIHRIDVNKYSPKDYKGEIIVAPENGIPTVIPIYIQAARRHDSVDEFEVRIIGNEMTTALDTLYIKNTGNRTMDSVRVVFSNDLARIFSLSESSFQQIKPSEEVAVEVKYNVKDLKTFMLDFNGEIRIVSEHHNMRSIPVNIQWNKIEDDNFVIYARNGDLGIGNDVLKHLEKHYSGVKSVFGTVDHKATIYMTGSMEETRLLDYNASSFYSYVNDIIFICSCDNPAENALQELIYRAVLRNFPLYYNLKKIENDAGNWLVDGMAKYFAVRNNENDAKKYIDAFKQEPVSFQWYGPPTDAQYGAAIAFFKYLDERHGEEAIYRSSHHLGSGMISNHRCDTLENCAVLRAAYDANGFNINDKKHDLSFETIMSEWVDYTNENYLGVKKTSQDS